PVLAAAGPDSEVWEPCRGALQLNSLHLELESRLVHQLGMDRPAAETGGWPVLRLVTEPDYSYGCAQSPPESVMTIYLPGDGEAVMELTRARTSIRAVNSGWIQLSAHPLTERPKVLRKAVAVSTESSRRPLPRGIAEALQHAAFR